MGFIRKYLTIILFVGGFVVASIAIVIIAIFADTALTEGVSYHDENDEMAGLYRVVVGCKTLDSLQPSLTDSEEKKVRKNHDVAFASILLELKGQNVYISENGDINGVNWASIVAAYDILARKGIYLDEQPDARELIQSFVGSLYTVTDAGESIEGGTGNPAQISNGGCTGFTTEKNEEMSKAIYNRAMFYVNNRTSIGDCSTFTRRVYSDMGITGFGASADQAKNSRQYCVKPEDLQPGDLVFWQAQGSRIDSSRSHYWQHIQHVAIYAGNGKVIETNTSKSAKISGSRSIPAVTDLKDMGSNYPIFMYTRPYVGKSTSGTTDNNTNIINVDSASDTTIKQSVFTLLEKLDDRYPSMDLKKSKNDYWTTIELRTSGLKYESEKKGCEPDVSCVAYELGETTFTVSGDKITMSPIASPVDAKGWGQDGLTVSSSFHDEENRASSHKATDIPVPEGTKVFAIFSGKVTAIHKLSSNCGNGLTVTNSSGYKFTYCHLSQSPIVNQGDEISMGAHVGYSGNTGQSTGPHLHVQVTDKNGKAYDSESSLANAYTYALNNTCSSYTTTSATCKGVTYHNIPEGLDPCSPPSGITPVVYGATVYGLFYDSAGCNRGMGTLAGEKYCKDQEGAAWEITPNFIEAASQMKLPRVVAKYKSSSLEYGTIVYIQSNVPGVPDYGYATVADRGGYNKMDLDLYITSVRDDKPAAKYNLGFTYSELSKLGGRYDKGGRNISVYVTPYKSAKDAYIYVTR